MSTQAEKFEARLADLVAQGVYASKGAARRGLIAQGDRDAILAHTRETHYAAGNPEGSFWFDRIEGGLAGITPKLPVR